MSHEIEPADAIVIGLTGPDWEPDQRTAYYAQRGNAYAFGANETEALANLLAAEARTAGVR